MTIPFSPSGKLPASDYLRFSLGGGYYGVPTRQIKEIVELHGIAFATQPPEGHFGAITLRGQAMPVIDLRVDFGTAAEFSDTTRVVVVQLGSGTWCGRSVGLVVDSAADVIRLDASEIEPPKKFGPGVDTSFLLGHAMVDRASIALLNVDYLATPEALAAAEAFAHAATAGGECA